MSAQLSLYFRNNEIIVVPQAGGGGFSYDIEPSTMVPPDAELLASAIREALETSTQARPESSPGPAASNKSPLLRKLKLKSFRELYRGSSHAYLYEDGGELFLLRFKPSHDGKGFDLDQGDPQHVARERLGESVLGVLQESPKMPN